MCRSIRTLRGAEPPPTSDDIRAASLQFVRKVSGYRQPSQRNRAAFEGAVDEIQDAVSRLLATISSPAVPGPETLLALRHSL
ncbi:MAG TPA: DUF2277 domain-containing protein [Candidatus Binatia bacterium]|nr:DUF2277 domain-containing protein [Candidatus Binatia bacterium]